MIFVMLVGITVSCSKQDRTSQTIEEIITSARDVVPRVLSVDAMLSDPYQLQTQSGYLLWIDGRKERVLTIYDIRQEKSYDKRSTKVKAPLRFCRPFSC